MPCWGWIVTAGIVGVLIGVGATIGFFVLFAEGMSDVE